MSMWFVYFLIKLDSLGNLFTATTIFIGLVLFVSGIVWVWCSEQPTTAGEEKTRKFVEKHIMKKFYAILFVFFLTLTTLLPTTKQAIVIYALPKIANNEQVKELPSNAVKLINEKMKQWLEEMEAKQ